MSSPKINFDLTVPTPAGDLPIYASTGSSVIFVGANGGGKTRLAVHFRKSSCFKLTGYLPIAR